MGKKFRRGREDSTERVADKIQDEYNTALELGQKIVDSIEEVPEYLRDKHSDFFESVAKKSADIVDRVKLKGYVTLGQHQALDNMLIGVRKWLHEDD